MNAIVISKYIIKINKISIMCVESALKKPIFFGSSVISPLRRDLARRTFIADPNDIGHR